MQTIDKLVTNLPFEERHRALLEQAAPEANIVYVDPRDKEGLAAELRDATVAVILSKPDVSAAKKLKWMHWDAAGLDAIAQDDYIRAGFAITGSAGRSAPALAEHVLYFMLNHAYRQRAVLAAQDAHRWGYEGQQETQALFSRTIGIVGLGHTGRALARRAKALEMRVLAYTRSIAESADVDRLYSPNRSERLEDMLPECDYLVLCCALTDQTYHMLGREQLALMKPTAMVINVGRGKTVDEAALLDALRGGRLAGAGLDTFETEPLPADSPIWDMQNLMVTPHFTPPCPDKLGRSLEIVLENIRRFHAEEPLLNQLKPENKFTA